MNIKEATEKAMKENGFIRRKDHAFKGILIKPTNTYDCCIFLVEGRESQQCRCWNPIVEDLLADDWETLNKMSIKKTVVRLTIRAPEELEQLIKLESVRRETNVNQIMIYIINKYFHSLET